MAGAGGWTTYSSNDSGAASNTRRSTSRPTTTAPRPDKGSAILRILQQPTSPSGPKPEHPRPGLPSDPVATASGITNSSPTRCSPREGAAWWCPHRYQGQALRVGLRPALTPAPGTTPSAATRGKAAVKKITTRQVPHGIGESRTAPPSQARARRPLRVLQQPTPATRRPQNPAYPPTRSTIKPSRHRKRHNQQPSTYEPSRPVQPTGSSSPPRGVSTWSTVGADRPSHDPRARRGRPPVIDPDRSSPANRFMPHTAAKE